MGRPPIRGRQLELQALAERVDLLREGTGGCLLIDGPPGMGRTRLLAELADLARNRELAVAGAVCDELDRYAPMLPLLTALRSGPDPVLPSSELDSAATHADRRFWFLERLRDVLGEQSRRTPVVVMLDDLQWADAATLMALRVLCSRLDTSAVLWAFAYNPGQASADLHRVLDRLPAGRLSLTALDRDDALALATDLLGRMPSTDARHLVDDAHGNPSLICELLRSAVEENASSEAGTMTVGAGVPGRFAGHVRRRLRGVSPDVRQLLEVGAVLGRSFTLDDAARMLARPAGLLIGTLPAALGTGLIVAEQDHLAFRHQLIHRAIYDELPEAMRVGLHREAARLLPGAPPEAATGFVTRTLDVLGADDERQDPPAGIDGVRSGPDPHLGRAREHLERGRLADAVCEAEKGRTIAEELGLAEPVAEALGVLGQVAFHQGDLAGAESYARAAGQASDDLPLDAGAGWVQVLLADASGRPDDALDVVLGDDGSADQDLLARLLEVGLTAVPHTARIALRAGREDVVRDLVRQARRLAGVHPGTVTTSGVAAHVEGIAHQDPEALACSAAAYQEAGRRLAAVMAGEDLGRTLLHAGDRAAAVVHLRRALGTAGEIGALRHADRIRRVLREAGVRHRFSSPRRQVSFGLGSLTDAELRVASLVAEGLTNQAIADRLFLSPHTINTHLRHVFDKLGVRSRVGLTRVLLAEMPRAAGS